MVLDIEEDNLSLMSLILKIIQIIQDFIQEPLHVCLQPAFKLKMPDFLLYIEII